MKTLYEIILICLLTVSSGSVYNLFAEKGLWNYNYDLGEGSESPNELYMDVVPKAWKDKALFLDVRSEFEYQEKHIKNAISLPYFSFEDSIAVLLPYLKSQKNIIVYCIHEECNSSEIICRRLIELGLKQTKFIKGGFREWERRGLPVETDTRSQIPDTSF